MRITISGISASTEHPWLSAEAGERGGLGDLDAIRRDYLPADYLVDAAGHDVVVAPSMSRRAGRPATASVRRVGWRALDKPGGVAARYVAHVPLAAATRRVLIDAQAAFAASSGCATS